MAAAVVGAVAGFGVGATIGFGDGANLAVACCLGLRAGLAFGLRLRMRRMCSAAVSHMRVDSAPWLVFTPVLVRPSKQAPRAGSAIRTPRSFPPRNQA